MSKKSSTFARKFCVRTQIPCTLRLATLKSSTYYKAFIDACFDDLETSQTFKTTFKTRNNRCLRWVYNPPIAMGELYTFLA